MLRPVVVYNWLHGRYSDTQNTTRVTVEMLDLYIKSHLLEVY
jgi:hypothetical protein